MRRTAQQSSCWMPRPVRTRSGHRRNPSSPIKRGGQYLACVAARGARKLTSRQCSKRTALESAISALRDAKCAYKDGSALSCGEGLPHRMELSGRGTIGVRIVCPLRANGERELGNQARNAIGRDVERSTIEGKEMAKNAQRKMRRDAVSPFRNKIWDLFKELASGMDGADVVLALKQAGEEIWAVGIDDVYSDMPHQDDEPSGNAFDITWLTIVCFKLKEIQQGKRPKGRIRASK